MDIEKDLTLALIRLTNQIIAETEGTYYPIEFRKMVEQKGGLTVTRELLSEPVSEGFLRLLQMKRKDLTFEYLILDRPEFQSLYTEAEIETCRRRVEFI